MTYSITVEKDYVRAELTGRETVAETKEFLRALARYSSVRSAFLLHLRASRPMFRIEQHGLIDDLKQIARGAGHRIALVADTRDLQVSHEYFELIAQQHHVNLRSFGSAAEALTWLREPAAPPAAA
jgi:hypothetical protein